MTGLLATFCLALAACGLLEFDMVSDFERHPRAGLALGCVRARRELTVKNQEV